VIVSGSGRQPSGHLRLKLLRVRNEGLVCVSCQRPGKYFIVRAGLHRVESIGNHLSRAQARGRQAGTEFGLGLHRHHAHDKSVLGRQFGADAPRK
jgi:hypothetical protein